MCLINDKVCVTYYNSELPFKNSRFITSSLFGLIQSSVDTLSFVIFFFYIEKPIISHIISLNDGTLSILKWCYWIWLLIYSQSNIGLRLFVSSVVKKLERNSAFCVANISIISDWRNFCTAVAPYLILVVLVSKIVMLQWTGIGIHVVLLIVANGALWSEFAACKNVEIFLLIFYRPDGYFSMTVVIILESVDQLLLRIVAVVIRWIGRVFTCALPKNEFRPLLCPP
jgi:hypothetical protein